MRRIICLALCLLVATTALGAYTEFYVTKGASVSDVNGGGPRLGANDAPTYTLAAGANGATATDNGADSDIEDLNNGAWGDTQVDDWLCFDTGGAKEFARVIAIDVGADTDVITVSPQVTAAAEKGCNVCGAWATIDGGGTSPAANLLDSTWINAAGDPPCINVKYDVAEYHEYVTMDNTGTSAIPLRIEGYETAAHDGCPNGNLPKVGDHGAGALAGLAVFHIAGGKDHWYLVNLYAKTAVAGDEAFQNEALYNRFINCRGSATGAGALASFSSTGNVTYFINCYSEDSAAAGFSLAIENTCINCVSNSAGTYGFLTTVSSSATLINCIADTAEEDGFYITGEFNAIVGCVAYACGNGGAGSGIYLGDPTDAPQGFIRNCILVSNKDYGIEAANAWNHHLDYNAYYDNGAGAADEWHDIHTTGDSAHDTSVAPHDVTLTGDPFTNAGGGDFSLDAIAGQGAACRDAGFPGAMLDGVNTGHIDIGALQHDDPAGGGTVSPYRGRLSGGLE